MSATDLAIPTSQQTTKAVAQIGDMAVIPIANVKAKIAHMQAIMTDIMVKNTHYGVIPGCQKPSLWQPGAEIICAAFRLRPVFDDDIRDLGNGHREVISRVLLFHINTGEELSQASGSCSTMEKKYRYRNDYKSTGVAVPGKYWDLKKANKIKEAADLMPKKGCTPKKTEDGKWIWFEASGLQENEDLADIWNTVLKMAHKRAFVAATRTVMGASGIFEQDIEDLPNYLRDGTIEADFEVIETLTPEDATLFTDTMGAYDDDKVAEFISLSVQSLKCSTDELKVSALKDMGRFTSAFENWLDRKGNGQQEDKQPEGKAETKAPPTAAPDGPVTKETAQAIGQCFKVLSQMTGESRNDIGTRLDKKAGVTDPSNPTQGQCQEILDYLRAEITAAEKKAKK